MRKILFSPPDITEAEISEVVKVMQSGWITTGPETKLFEKRLAQYCNTEKAVCLNSATACMESTLRFLGVGKGDEVITSAYTYTASASVICHVGAKPVLVDTKPGSFEMDYEKLEHAITERTKVVIPVDIAGIMCDYKKLYDVLERKKKVFAPQNRIQEAVGRVIVLADAAHSFGATYLGKRSGEVADFTSFSFHAVKNLTTAEGGCVTWRTVAGIDSQEIYRQFMLQSLHGQTKDALSKTRAGDWEYDIVEPAYKCNMTDIMAAIGMAQLTRYDTLLKKRRQIIEVYQEKLQDQNVQLFEHYSQRFCSSGHLYLTRLLGRDEDYRNQFIVKMAERGIVCNVHYKPLPLLTAYQKMGFSIQDYPNAYDLFHNEVTLPLYSKMTLDDAEYVADHFIEILNGE